MTDHPNVIALPRRRSVIGEHLRRVTIHITRYYPDHEDRVASEEYRHTRHQLIVVQQLPCWICGTRDKLESHHFYVEWADQNAVDWDVFQKRHPNVVDWSQYRDNPARFVDSPENMRILCAKHHRHVNHGIHCLTYSDWELQAWPKPGYVWTPSEAPKTKKIATAQTMHEALKKAA